MPFFCCFWVLFLLFYQANPLTISCESQQRKNDLERCLKPFNDIYQQGVVIFTQVNSSMADYICSRYEESRTCMVMMMHDCADIKKSHNADIKAFEYACTADRTGDWPYSPTVMPLDGDEDPLMREHVHEYYADLVKISIAAFVTLLLVLTCAAAELATKLKLRRRIKKASAEYEVLQKKMSSNNDGGAKEVNNDGGAKEVKV